MIRKFIVIYILIGSLNVYNLALLGDLINLINLSAVALMIAILIFDLVYGKRQSIHQIFKWPIFVMLIAVFLSMFMAYFAFDQKFLITIYAQRDIYFYLLYFTLHALNIEKKELQRLIILFGLLYTAFYVIQYFSFPTKIFEVGMYKGRGTIRIFLEGSGYAMISYFMCLQIFYSTSKIKYLILAIIFFIPIILFGARSGISTMTLGTIVQLLFSRVVKSKVLITFLILLALVPTFYIFQDVFMEVIKAQKLESAEGSENIRILAGQYYLTSFLPNNISYITGIGAQSAQSALGRLTMMLSSKYGFYITDVGIIGNYVTYGILFVFALFWIVYKILFSRILLDMIFIKYFTFFEVLLMLPIAAGFALSPVIAGFCCLFYLIDLSAHERKQPENIAEQNQERSDTLQL